MGWRQLLPGPFLGAIWPSFTPGLRISVVTHNKAGSTAQRERWDFYPEHVKLENVGSALFSLRLQQRAAAGGISPGIS